MTDLIDIFASDLRPYQYWSGQARLKFQDWSSGIESGRSTGFSSIDEYARLEPADLFVIAARPSQGKTALAMQMAMKVAKELKEDPEDDGVVAFFSAEMPGWLLSMRLTATVAGVNLHKAKRGQLDAAEQQRLLNADQELYDLPIWIDDNSGPSSAQMLEQLSKLNAILPIRLLVFDFMELSGDQDRSENLRLGQVAHNLKGIAKTLQIPVIAISQLNRDVDNRSNKIPALADLRYSGMIEQLADVVAFIVRPQYYVDRGINIDCKGEDRDGIANIYISKNRNGPVGNVRLGFNEDLIEFHELKRVPIEFTAEYTGGYNDQT